MGEMFSICCYTNTCGFRTENLITLKWMCSFLNAQSVKIPSNPIRCCGNTCRIDPRYSSGKKYVSVWCTIQKHWKSRQKTIWTTQKFNPKLMVSLIFNFHLYFYFYFYLSIPLSLSIYLSIYLSI